MKLLIIPILIFYSNINDVSIATKGMSIIESQCNIKFNINNKKKMEFNKSVHHHIFISKDFNYYQELKKENYRIYLTDRSHNNFSHHNYIWISNKSSETTIPHELMHMLTGDLYHTGKNHILAPNKDRNLKIKIGRAHV